MKKNSLFIVGIMMFFSLGFVACSDDDQPTPAAIDKEVEIEATAFDQWTYFSFKTGKVLKTKTAFDENLNSLDWDIAFHRYDVKTNSGTSGTGKGGAYLAEGKMAKTGWDEVTEAPSSGYTVDSQIKITSAYGQNGAVYSNTSGSTVITGGMGKKSWLIFAPGANGPAYNPTNQIFVVKTAEGKYAKVWLKAYQKLINGSKKGGYITMKYAYQEDGSTSLQ